MFINHAFNAFKSIKLNSLFSTDGKKIKNHVKPNDYILMSARMSETFHCLTLSLSLALFFFSFCRICCQYCNLWKFMFSCRKMNFPFSQFHVLWIFIIHLCSTISHLCFPRPSFKIYCSGQRQRWIFIVILSRFSQAPLQFFMRTEPICSWKFNQLQFVGMCFSFNIPISITPSVRSKKICFKLKKWHQQAAIAQCID